jgi:hypothetical protein
LTNLSRVVADTEWQSSSGAVQKNLDTRLAKPTVIPPGDAMRKAAIAEKIMLLQKKNQFKSSGRLNFDGEEVTVNGESCGEKLVKDGKAVNAKLVNERCKPEILKNSGVGDGEASAVAKLKDQKVEVLAETKRLAGEPSKKDDLGSSGMEILTASLLTICILLLPVFANNICILGKTIEIREIIKILNMIML